MIERRRGICRTVYLVGPWAIKTPRLHWPRDDDAGETVARARMWAISRAVQANLSEVEWSGVAGVAPVLRSWLGGLVNVYPRCEPWPEDRPEPPYADIGDLCLPKDSKRTNVGLLDGEPVWLDYDGSWNGCPHERAAHDITTPEGDDD